MSDVHDRVIAEVYVAGNVQEVYFVKGLLEQAGIEARVVGDDLQTGVGELPPGWRTDPRIWVNAAEETRARNIIAGYESRRKQEADGTESLPSWRCGECGESVDGPFEICWNCQSPRPGSSGKSIST